MILEIIAVLMISILGLIIFGFAYLGASHFFDELENYKQESKYFLEEK